jgi:uncharacterized membrane protein YcgQ (UPF0703/DUF1980 family)
MIRIDVGMVLRINEMITFANANTAVTDIVITTAGSSFAVTANAEHIPSTCTITGFSFDSGEKSGFSDLGIVIFCCY